MKGNFSGEGKEKKLSGLNTDELLRLFGSEHVLGFGLRRRPWKFVVKASRVLAQKGSGSYEEIMEGFLDA